MSELNSTSTPVVPGTSFDQNVVQSDDWLSSSMHRDMSTISKATSLTATSEQEDSAPSSASDPTSRGNYQHVSNINDTIGSAMNNSPPTTSTNQGSLTQVGTTVSTLAQAKNHPTPLNESNQDSDNLNTPAATPDQNATRSKSYASATYGNDNDDAVKMVYQQPDTQRTLAIQKLLNRKEYVATEEGHAELMKLSIQINPILRSPPLPALFVHLPDGASTNAKALATFYEASQPDVQVHSIFHSGALIEGVKVGKCLKLTFKTESARDSIVGHPVLYQGHKLNLQLPDPYRGKFKLDFYATEQFPWDEFMHDIHLKRLPVISLTAMSNANSDSKQVFRNHRLIFNCRECPKSLLQNGKIPTYLKFLHHRFRLFGPRINQAPTTSTSNTNAYWTLIPMSTTENIPPTSTEPTPMHTSEPASNTLVPTPGTPCTSHEADDHQMMEVQHEGLPGSITPNSLATTPMAVDRPFTRVTRVRPTSPTSPHQASANNNLNASPNKTTKKKARPFTPSSTTTQPIQGHSAAITTNNFYEPLQTIDDRKTIVAFVQQGKTPSDPTGIHIEAINNFEGELRNQIPIQITKYELLNRNSKGNSSNHMILSQSWETMAFPTFCSMVDELVDELAKGSPPAILPREKQVESFALIQQTINRSSSLERVFTILHEHGNTISDLLHSNNDIVVKFIDQLSRVHYISKQLISYYDQEIVPTTELFQDLITQRQAQISHLTARSTEIIYQQLHRAEQQETTNNLVQFRTELSLSLFELICHLLCPLIMDNPIVIQACIGLPPIRTPTRKAKWYDCDTLLLLLHSNLGTCIMEWSKPFLHICFAGEWLVTLHGSRLIPNPTGPQANHF